MYNTIGITFGVGIWATFILFVSLIVSRSWIIFIFILINIVVFVYFGLAQIKKFPFVNYLGSKFISGICYVKSKGWLNNIGWF